MTNTNNTEMKSTLTYGVTTQYDMFNFHEENRNVNPKHVKQLEKLIKNNGYNRCSFIIVDREFKIIDGQHRYQACVNLGLPIQYLMLDIVSKKDDFVQMNICSSAWKSPDYAKSNVDDKFYSFALNNGGLTMQEMGIIIDHHSLSNDIKKGDCIMTPAEENLFKNRINVYSELKKYKDIIHYNGGIANLYKKIKNELDDKDTQDKLFNFLYSNYRTNRTVDLTGNKNQVLAKLTHFGII